MTTSIVARPPTRPPLTAQQMEIYAFIRGYMAHWHSSPTLHDLVDQLRLRSVVTAREHLFKIAKKGWITFDATVERGIAIVAEPTS